MGTGRSGQTMKYGERLLVDRQWQRTKIGNEFPPQVVVCNGFAQIVITPCRQKTVLSRFAKLLPFFWQAKQIQTAGPIFWKPCIHVDITSDGSAHHLPYSRQQDSGSAVCNKD